MCGDYYYMSRYSHPKYTDDKEILKLFKEYKTEQDKQNLPYEISGVLVKLGIPKDRFNEYLNYNPDGVEGLTEEEKKGYRKRTAILKKISDECAASLAKWGMENPKSQAMAMFLLKQKLNGGYTDKQEFTTTGNVSISVKLTDDKGKTIK